MSAGGLPPHDDGLRQLAERYRALRGVPGLPRPTAALAEELGVSSATVRRRLVRAVEAGHLAQGERANRGLDVCRTCGRPKED